MKRQHQLLLFGETLQNHDSQPVAVRNNRRGRPGGTMRSVHCPKCAQRGQRSELRDSGGNTWVCAACGHQVDKPPAARTPPWCGICRKTRMVPRDGYWGCPRCGAELLPGDEADGPQVPMDDEPRAPSRAEILDVYHEDIAEKRAQSHGGGSKSGGRKRKKLPRKGRPPMDDSVSRGDQPRGYRRANKGR